MTLRLPITVIALALIAVAVSGEARERTMSDEPYIPPSRHLSEVAKEGGFAVSGTIVSAKKSSTSFASGERAFDIKIVVERVWGKPTGGYPIGSQQVFESWSLDPPDPFQTRDYHLVGARIQDLADLKVGEHTVILYDPNGLRSVHALQPSSELSLVLDVAFDPGGIKNYQKTSSIEQLSAGLADDDLRRPALAALVERQQLDPRALLRLTQDQASECLSVLGELLSAEALNKFLVAMIDVITDGPKRIWLWDLLAEKSVLSGKATVQTRRALALTLDGAEVEQTKRLLLFLPSEVEALRQSQDRALGKLLIALARKVKHPPHWMQKETGEVFGTLMAALPSPEDRSDFGRSLGALVETADSEMLSALLRTLPSRERAELAMRVAALIGTSAVAKKSRPRVDAELLDVFVSEVVRAPDCAYLPALAAIDLSAYPKGSQAAAESRVSVLDAGLAIAHADPSSATAVYGALKRWLGDAKTFHPDMIMSIEGSTEKLQHHWLITVRQFKALGGQEPAGR
jgi:hypothetical protein